MKHFRKCLFCTILAAAPAAAQTTIDQCMQASMENYPQIQQLELIRKSEAYDLSNASKSWIPQLKISGKASYQSDVTEMPFEIPGYDFNLPLDQYSLTGEVTQTLWDGGMSRTKKQAIRTESEVRQRQLQVNVYSIYKRVQNLYLGILLIDEQLKQNGILEQNLQRNLKDAQASIDNGMAYKSDADIIRVKLLNCDQNKTELLTTRESYLSMLEEFTGMNLKGVELSIPQITDSDIDTSHISRPELDLIEAQLQQNEALAKQIDVKISPTFTLSLQGGIGRPGLNMLKSDFQPYYTAGIRMNWDIGALYTRRNDINKNKATKEQIENDRETFLFNTHMDITSQQAEIAKTKEALERDEKIISLRESIRTSGEEQYRNGVITMTDLMERINDEYDARTARSIHQIQLLMAYYELKNIIGYY